MRFNNTSPRYVEETGWELMHREIVCQCDGIDGAVDGIVEDTSLCFPQFAHLNCNDSRASSECLSSAKPETIVAAYQSLQVPGTKRVRWTGALPRRELAVVHKVGILAFTMRERLPILSKWLVRC